MPRSATELDQALARRFDAAAGGLRSMAPPGRQYLVAVSGGCDSVVLLHWLAALGYRKLRVVHVNHQLRGPASSADARFVKRLSGSMELPFHLEQAPLHGTGSIETEARALRYAAFAGVSREVRCPRLILAHHGDDQAETVLWNLMRGCGLDGLGGMAPWSERRIAGRRMGLLRPLLALSRADLVAYARAHRLRWREDESNRDLGFTRNRIRHELLPLMEQIADRPVGRSLGQMADIVREEHAVAEALVLPIDPVPGVKEMQLWPVAIQRRWFMRWLRHHQVPDLSHSLIESIRAMLAPGGPAKVNLPGDRHCRRTSGRLYLTDPD